MAVILVKGVPHRVLAEMGSARGETGMPHSLASSMSMKSPSAPESMSAATVWVIPSDWSTAGRVGGPPEGQ